MTSWSVKVYCTEFLRIFLRVLNDQQRITFLRLTKYTQQKELHEIKKNGNFLFKETDNCEIEFSRLARVAI